MDLSNKIIFITGATGCLGSNLLEMLQQCNCKEIRCLVSGNQRFYDENKNSVITQIKGRLEDKSKIFESLTNVDVVIHCAAKVHSYKKNERNLFYDINYKRSIDLFRCAIEKKVSRFIFISTVAVYKVDQVVNEQTELDPVTDYGKSKFLAEENALELFNSEQFPVTILQLSTLFGRGDRGNFKSLFNMIKSGLVPLVGTGRNIKTFTYVKDAVNAILLAIENESSIGKRIIIADSGQTLDSMIRSISNQINKNAIVIKIPINIVYIILKMIDKVTKKNYLYKAVAAAKETKYDVFLSNIILGNYIQYGFEKGFIDCKNWYINSRT